MREPFSTAHIDGINRSMSETSWIAKRSKINPHECVVGVDRDTPGCVTVILSEDSEKRPQWWVCCFDKATPGDMSDCHDVGTPYRTMKSYYWADMLKCLKEGTEQLKSFALEQVH